MKSLVLALAVFVIGCATKPASHECASGIVCPDPLQCAAVQPVCISNSCGNGIVDPGELCDDGNIINGDGCAADCKSAEACGDGVVNTDAGEVCDDGNTVDGDGCSGNCRSNEVCGNGITDLAKGEVCDDGNTHAGTCSGDAKPCDSTADCTSGMCVADGCSSDCKSNETCGNGIKDLGEVCDDAHATGGCEDDCLHGAGCGNGVLDTGEQCDDGNSINNDDCKNDCTPNVCGDNVVDSAGSFHHEDCDPGSGGVAIETATCNIDCTTAKCGDGKINSHYKQDGSHGEQCDLGSTTATPPVNLNQDNVDCTSACLVNVCGDGFVDNTGVNHHETCDDQNTNTNDGCRNDCQTATCGDGVVQIGTEACDDGNSVDTDACRNTCVKTFCGDSIQNNGEACDPTAPHVGSDKNGATLCNADCTVSTCGDGKVNSTAGETCDDGNTLDTDACPSGAANPNKCKIAACGDGNVFTGVEQCDTGNVTDTSTCYAAKCTTSTCGDSHINSAAGEVCDNGAMNGTPGNACNAFCQVPSCGNGQIDAGEQCDSGTGHPNTATCDSDCTNPVCGDGLVNTAFGEQCDNGVNNTLDSTCPYGVSCATRCDTTCHTLAVTTPSCGDGLVDGDSSHVETCDDSGATESKAYCTYGVQSACTACHTCTLVVLPARYCGNSIVEANNGGTETCDPPGVSGCRSGSTDKCTSCTDGVQNGGESDIDCGGGAAGCTTCAKTKKCTTAADCASGYCDTAASPHVCATPPPTCTDGISNGGETGVDCGGTSTCGGCAGDPCAANSDCHSNACDTAGTHLCT